MNFNTNISFLLMFIFISCKGNSEQTEFFDYQVETNQEIGIQLGVSFSSGYQWILSDSLSSELELVEESFLKNDSLNFPFPEIQSWKFKSKTPGSYNITFIYKRPWEEVSEGQNIKVYKILVK